MTELVAAAARRLQAAPDAESTMRTAVELAQRDIEGVDAAALSVIRARRRIETPAATSRAARSCDELQYDLGEGPCLDAVWEAEVVDVPDLSDEPRWPRWTPRVVDEAGFRSMTCYRLFLADQTVGALNLYSCAPDGFSAVERDHGTAIAAHIAVAVRDAQQIDQLQAALDNRTVIGQATGIIMERSDLDAFQAFVVLTNVASDLDRKVRSVAEEFVVTRRLPGTPEGVGRPPRAPYDG